MDFVSPIITPSVESLLGPVKRHLGFLVSSSNKVKYMRDRMTELNDMARDVEAQKERNDASNLVVPHHVPGWLEEVKTINAKADNIPTGRVGCFNIKMRYTSGKRSSCLVNDIDRLMTEKSNFGWTVEKRPLAKVSSSKPSTSTPVHEDEYDGTQSIIKSSRDLIFNDALISLESNDNKARMIALSGMGGVGKTTMMEQLVKAVDDRKTFNWIVKVAIGNNRSSVDIQAVIAERIGEPLSEKDKDARADRLKERFQRMSEEGKKKILVILDDIWEKINLKDIGLSSPLPNGFKLLLISREEDVCTQMDVETSLIFKIGGLKDEEAKKLFWETARLGSNSDIEQLDMVQIGEEILKICGGLPLAITTIASTLREKEKVEWEDALSRLQNKNVDDYGIKEIFVISFENLKEDDLKAIFLLSGLFPEDSDIVKEDLLRYGWGLNFYQNVPTIAEARRRVNTCVNKLIRSNLLIKSDREECVKIHDLVRDFVLSQFSVVKQASIVAHDNNVSKLLKEDESYERLLLKCGSMLEFPIHFNHKNLKLLKLMDGAKLLKFPEEFFTRMMKLEVVSYTNMYRPLLPQCLTNLRALCLRSCSLVDNDVSILGDLINLEVLDLAGCGINKLPSKIGQLRRLKLLDLTGCFNLYIDNGVFENLKQLEELYMGVCEGSSVRFSDSNCDELKILSRQLFALELEFFNNKAQPVNISFENLERFKISIGCLLEKRLRSNSNDGYYSFENTLRLKTTCSELRECKINVLFRETKILKLKVNDMSYLEDILIHPPQNAFCNLKSLSISKCEGLTYLFTMSMANSLKKIENLIITSCSALQYVVNGENTEAGVVTFHKLKVLSLRKLPELVSLCDGHVNVTELPHLMELDLDGLPNNTSIFTKNNTNISSGQPFFNKEVLIPKLEELTITSMENLKEIWECEIATSEGEVNNIFMLREIRIHNCDSVVNLFPNNPMRLLTHLEELKVGDCGSIEVLFNIELGQIQQHSRCRLRNIEVMECKSLREVWRIKGAEDNYFIGGFQDVEIINIRSCERFRNIVTPTTVNFDMKALKDIRIVSCDEYGERNNESFKNSQEQEINNISKERISKVDDSLSTAAFTSNQMASHFHQLREICFQSVKGVKVVFEMESPISNTDQPPLLPYLEQLEIINMEKLSHVWKCHNWNEFFILYKQHPQSSSFQNLTSIFLWSCPSIKYLFSPLMLKLLSNLKTIKIWDCDGMEEVVSNRDDDDEELTSSSYAQTVATLFPCLHLLDLEGLKNLKHIGGQSRTTTDDVSHGQSMVSQVDVVSWSLCQYSTKINAYECDALSSVIPYYAAGQTLKLQELSISGCTSMMEVFESKEITGNNTNGCSSSTTVAIPRSTYSTVHKLPHLKILHINDCDCLENIFTFSTLESLKKLEELTISKCDAMKVIVREEVQEDTTTLCKKVVFTSLKSIELDGLPNLTGFFLGMNIDFEWPLLEYVKIKHCPQMTVFTSGQSTTPRLKYINTGLGQHDLECGPNFHQVSQVDVVSWSLCQYSTKIDIHKCDALSSVIPYYAAGQTLKLQELSISGCTSMMEVFESKEITGNNINGCSGSTAVAIPRPAYSTVQKLPHLKILRISFCDCLENVFTFSTLESLKKLEELMISKCDAMKVIVREEVQEDTTTLSKKVVFTSLKSIELDDLPNLAGFFLGMNIDFEWPLLEHVKIEDCPQMTVFTSGWSTTPRLKHIHTGLGQHTLEHGLNFHQTPSTSFDCISSNPTISEGRTCSFHNLIQCNLGYPHKDTKIFPSSELQKLEKLETIHAQNCENVEEVFEVASQVTNNESQTSVKFPKLREVELEWLNNLKYIWKSNEWRILEFPNLTRLSISSCYSLEYVFTCSMVGCVKQLQELHIQCCGKMKVVVKGEEEEDCDTKVSEIIKFPCLKSLNLNGLSSLEGFCLGKEDFTFPSLDTLQITVCPEIMVFTKGRSIIPEQTVLVETSFGSFNVGEDINSFIMTKKQEGFSLGE